MTEEEIREMLAKVKAGEISVDTAFSNLKNFSYADIGFAKIDHHRKIRQGFSEVIYGEGKTVEQIRAIAKEIIGSGQGRSLLVTRTSKESYEAIVKIAPNAQYHPIARAVTVATDTDMKKIGNLLILCAGTSDLPVAEECRVTAEIMGSKTELVCDVGVAGIHRLFAHTEQISNARVIVVVAGMDGALASVVGGLTSVPVVALPTSVGYGASFGGISALLAMLNSCSAGISVVNIDNGFGAGVCAHKINLAGEGES